MRLMIMLLRQAIHRVSRRAFWLWRLHHARIGNTVSISFPLKLEGSGAFTVGDNATILENVRIGVGAGSAIALGDSCTIRDSVTLLTGEKGKITLGAGCEIGSHTSLWTGNVWTIGAGSAINCFCQVFAREPGAGGRLIMGKNSHVGDYTTIDVCDDVIIGDGVALGGYNIIHTHEHEKAEEGPIWSGGVKRGRVVIEDGAMIGVGVVILPGVTIGKRSIIAAGAIVNSDIPEESMASGNPARAFRLPR